VPLEDLSKGHLAALVVRFDALGDSGHWAFPFPPPGASSEGQRKIA
jgi:hypothetical protein